MNMCIICWSDISTKPIKFLLVEDKTMSKSENIIPDETIQGQLVKAAELCQKAEQGDASVQYNLAVCYDNGVGVEKDKPKAVELYKKAAEQGHLDAQCNLGVCYQYGTGVEKDEQKAVELYQKVADQGHAQAQHNLGRCYKNETGVEKDEQKAVELY